MGNLVPINPAGGSGNLPQQIKTPQITPPSNAIAKPPIQVPIGQSQVGQTPGVPAPVTVHISKMEPKDPKRLYFGVEETVLQKIENCKQKIGSIILNSSDYNRIVSLDYLITQLNSKNVDAINAIINREGAFYSGSLYYNSNNRTSMNNVLKNGEASQIFGLLTNWGSPSLESTFKDTQNICNLINSSLARFGSQNPSDEEFAAFKELLISIHNANNKLKSMAKINEYNLFNSIIIESQYRYSGYSVNREPFVNTLKLAAKLCQSEKLLDSPNGLLKIPMFIEHKNAFDTVISDLLKQ